MNRCRWTYISPAGSRAIVGVLHDPKKGQLAVYCDKKIILAELNVFDTNTFTFFLDEELCKIRVEKIGDQFAYRFDIDTKTNTPLNQRRRVLERKHLIYSLLTFSGLFLVVGLTVFIGNYLKIKELQGELDTSGVLTTAVIQVVQVGQDYHFLYRYQTPQGFFQEKIGVFDSPTPILKNNLPVQAGDFFFLTYASLRPSNHVFHLNYPTASMEKRYRQYAKRQYLSAFPKDSPAYCDCLLKVAYSLKGWEGYAQFLHLRTPRSKNRRFNQSTFETFVQSKDFQKEEVHCWKFKD